MKIAITICSLLIVSSLANAGGTSVLGKVTKFSEKDGGYSFHFVQSEIEYEMMEGCTEFDVNLKYEPYFDYYWLVSWLFIFDYPSESETKNAVTFLKSSLGTNKEFNFGYYGSRGLYPTKTKCIFRSSGLTIDDYENTKYVISYHKNYKPR